MSAATGGTARRAIGGARPAPDSGARLLSLRSPIVGVVSGVYENLYERDDARLSFTFCRVASPARVLHDAPDEGFAGSGAHQSRESAVISAIGEAIERYCGSSVGTHVPTRPATAAALRASGHEVLDPASTALFHASQHATPDFPYGPFTDDTPLRWMPARDLGSGRTVQVPVSFVYLHAPPVAGERLVTYSTSSGLACGGDPERATAGALFENLERDAFVIAWRHRLRMPRVNYDAHPALHAFDRDYLAPAGIEHVVLDYSPLVGVPCAVACVIDDSSDDRPAFAVGAACAATMETAVRKALAEGYHGRVYARRLHRDYAGREFRDDFDDIRTLHDHVAYYARREHLDKVAFLHASTDVVDIRDCPDLESRADADVIREVTERAIEGTGAHAYAVDVTTPDIADAGLYVMRVLTPELVKLDVSHRRRFLGGDRLLRRPFELGLRADVPTVDALNHDPHPFP